jgi:L-asparaginase
MRNILIVSVGGVIATRLAGSSPGPRGEKIRAMLPRADVSLAFEEFANVPGSHLTPAQGLELSRRVAAALARPEVDGVVVTHGPDTIEETAYLLDLTLASPKPVVLTGALRAATSYDYDGDANLAAAIRVAAAPAAQELGVLVVFDDAIHAAAAVQMVHTQARGAFASPGAGPLGRVEDERIWIGARPAARQQIACARIEERVDLLRLAQGADVRLLRHCLADGVAGVVIEAFGAGRVPPWWLPTIAETVQSRVAVVIAGRPGAGGLGDEFGYVGAYHDLRRAGVLFAHNLGGPKARIKLMAALGAARGPQELRTLFS